MRRVVLLLAACGAFALPKTADAQMFCRESLSDHDYKIEVSVCVIERNRDLIVLVRNLDKRRKEVTFPECSVDLTSIGGGKHRTGRVRLLVYESRPNNRHVIAPQISPDLANGFRGLSTNNIQCMYVAKILDREAGSRVPQRRREGPGFCYSQNTATLERLCPDEIVVSTNTEVERCAM